MRTIAVVNQKGGCGKSITAINLSAFLARERRRTLLVDMDPQGHATLGLLASAVRPSRTMYHMFAHEHGAPATRLRDIRQSVFENLDVAPADILLSAAPERLMGVHRREYILAEALSEIRDEYDYAVVDCPPNVGLLTFNALMACSEAIVPMDPSFFSLHGIGKLLETIDVVTSKTGHQIAARVLVTLYTGRTKFARQVVDEIRTHLQDRYFETTIRYSVKLAEAASHGLPIVAYCRRCAGFSDYKALAAEVIQLEADEPTRGDVVAIQGGRIREDDPEEVSSPSAPSRTPEGILFTLEAPKATRVQLVGDFNAWTFEGSEMKPTGRIWKKVLNLGPGRYRYRYVVDGCWLSDPLNADVEPAPYGGHNSVLVLNEAIPESGAANGN